MQAEKFAQELDSDFFTGVPDSQLGEFCAFLMQRYAISPRHCIAANEGNSVGLAAGYYLATGKPAVVYLQNSGMGNIFNPVVSLLHPKVYGIPCIFVIGWRGEPGVSDEPQHVYQGEITLSMLREMELPYFVVDSETQDAQLNEAVERFRAQLAQGCSVAFVVKKKGITHARQTNYRNRFSMTRENAIRQIVETAHEDVVVCTTGKASRELFEIREQLGQSHARDFLTVGSMGQASSIALGIALAKPDVRVWCIDGDGAALMQLGAMALIGARKPHNLIHVLLNNQAHESVGGMPIAAPEVDFLSIARACGYPYVESADAQEGLTDCIAHICTEKQLCFLEVCVAIGSRSDLGRPTETPKQNKGALMAFLHNNEIPRDGK